MSFQAEYFKLARLYETNKAWRLLRSDNAPFVIAFLVELFSEESEVEYGRARVALDAELDKLRSQGHWNADTSAAVYLNQWRHAGWLRELNNQLSKTDACDTAVRIATSLDSREAGTTASHLRIVQDAVRDLAIALSPNVKERIILLESQRAALQLEIESLQRGHIKKLDEAQQKERIREIYQLASVLTGDFRWVEDQRRNGEFKDQLDTILSTPAAKHLTAKQYQYLHHLLRELTRESDRVFTVRRRTEESLRAYIESGAYAEKHSVDVLLTKLERLALTLREQDADPKTTVGVSLDSGFNYMESLKPPSPPHKPMPRPIGN